MLPNIKFHNIKVFSCLGGKDKEVFNWEFKQINFIIGKNETGKTTFFHIMKDILGNPNPAGNNTSGKTIFMKALLLKNLKVRLTFSIGAIDFTTEKTYAPTVRQTFFRKGDNYNIGSIKSFLEYLYEKKIIGLPNVIFNGKSKITLYSIMRLCFISQNHFGDQSKPEKGKWSNMIIKHYNDGRTIILFYAYVLGILEDEKLLNEYYNILGDLSSVDNKIENVRKQLRLITDHKDLDLSLGLFNDTSILESIGKKQNKRRSLILDKYNYNEILDNISELYSFNKKVVSSESLEDYKKIIENDIFNLRKKLTSIQEEITSLNKEINFEKKQLDSIDDMLIEHHLYKLNSLDADKKSLYKTLIKEEESYKIEQSKLGQKYTNIKKVILESEKGDLFFTMVKEINNFLGQINLEIHLEKGKYGISTSADSINRIVLFNILLSFVLLKDKLHLNHPGFVFFDSPFVGLDKDRELNSIKNFIEHCDSYSISGQFFISINPEELNIDNLINNESSISVKKITNKLFEF